MNTLEEKRMVHKADTEAEVKIKSLLLWKSEVRCVQNGPNCAVIGSYTI